jgi:PEP-CTERM motif-containing protein
MRRGYFVAFVACLSIVAWPRFSTAAPIAFAPADYDNTPNTVTNPGAVKHQNQGFGQFRDVFWWSTRNSAVGVGSPDYINRGNSLIMVGGGPQHAVPGPGPYTALNFTGNSPAAGASYMSIYDKTPGNIDPTNLFDASQPGGFTISADVLFAAANHSVSGGIVAMYDEGQDALALLAHQGGGNNPDHARLDLVFQAAGQGTVLNSISLPGLTSYSGGEWYRVTMHLLVTGDTWTMNGTIHDHADPTNPNSALAAQIVAMNHVGSLTSPGNTLDLSNPGEIGVMAQANQAFGDAIPDPLHPTVDNVGVSITNFVIPEPTTLTLLTLGGLAVLLRRRR